MSGPKFRIASILAIAAITISTVALPSAKADVLRIGGTGAATELMKLLGAAFEAKEKDTKVEVIPGLGSSGAIAATMDGALDLAISARPLKPAETGLSEKVGARTPFVLVSSNPAPGNIATKDIAGFYSSATSTWPDGSALRVILRPKSESDTALLGATFPGMAEAIEQVRNRIDVPQAATDQDNLKMAAAIKGSLVATSLAQLVTEHHRLQLLTIDGVEPTLENLESGKYPHSKPFRFVFPATPAPLVERFVAFVASADGESLLHEAGCLAEAQ